MARTRYHIGPGLTKTQTLLGWLYLPFFLVLNSLLLSVLARTFHLKMTELQRQMAYFAMNFAFVILVFHRWYLRSFRGLSRRFWPFVQTFILGAVMYFALGRLLSLLLASLMRGGTANNQVLVSFIHQNELLMLILTVFIAPVVEETLFRGVVFGSLHGISRYLAYAVSGLVFALAHVLPHYGGLNLLQMAVQTLVYLVPPVALGWTYEKSGTILCPILLHAFINALAFSQMAAF